MARLHVLVVDEDLLARSILRVITPALKGEYLKEHTDSPEKALEIIYANRNDDWLIITGYDFGGAMTGLDLITQIWAATPPIRVFTILLSLSAEKLKDDPRAVKVDALLSKPLPSNVDLRRHVSAGVESLSR